MKKINLLLMLCSISYAAISQDTPEKIMEKRARDMHHVMGLDSKEAWTKFVRENYTQAFIEKPMRTKIERGDDSAQESAPVKGTLEGKAMMFSRLHDDFGSAKITSLKVDGETVAMVVEGNDGMVGDFKIKFNPIAPYLIEGVMLNARH